MTAIKWTLSESVAVHVRRTRIPMVCATTSTPALGISMNVISVMDLAPFTNVDARASQQATVTVKEINLMHLEHVAAIANLMLMPTAFVTTLMTALGNTMNVVFVGEMAFQKERATALENCLMIVAFAVATTLHVWVAPMNWPATMTPKPSFSMHPHASLGLVAAAQSLELATTTPL